MVKRYKSLIIVAVSFIALSILAYYIHYLIFHDAHHIFIYMIGDLAFLPLEVFLVIIVIERLLSRREKKEMLNKLNMVIGAFYSEVGTNLLRELLPAFDNHAEISTNLNIDHTWTAKEFKKATTFAQNIHGDPNPEKLDLVELRSFFISKRPFLLALLENSNLLEDERFSDVLWAAFHLNEELEARPTVQDLPETDLQHIAGDIRRLYGQLISEWLAYVMHLKVKYPFLYSFVLRSHPFQKRDSVMVTS